MAAVSVENLSKVYRIGLKDEIPDTLIGAAATVLRAPWKNFHRLRRLNTFAADAGNGRSSSDEADLLWALKDVSFEVQEGDVVGIIGRNGAGKSTLLKVLSRITEPTAGRAVIHGRVSSLLEVGTGFHPELTGRENVYMNGTILGMTKREIDRKFDAIVDFSGVERFLDTPVKRYSSGMKVRLAFSVAAHLEPEILIIDEVLAVGDADFQNKCLGKMEETAWRGRTVLFVSHNMAAVQRLCKRAVLLRQGALVVDGTVEDAVDEYVGYLERITGISMDNPERSGTGDVRLTAVRVRDHAGRETTSVIAGLRATFEFDYQQNRTCSPFSLAVTVLDSRGTAITTFNTQYNQVPIDTKSSQGTISCRLDRVPFLPGRYRVAAAIQDGKTNLDVIPNVIFFSVDSSCFFGSSRVPDRRYCACLVDHVWT